MRTKALALGLAAVLAIGCGGENQDEAALTRSDLDPPAEPVASWVNVPVSAGDTVLQTLLPSDWKEGDQAKVGVWTACHAERRYWRIAFQQAYGWRMESSECHLSPVHKKVRGGLEFTKRDYMYYWRPPKGKWRTNFGQVARLKCVGPSRCAVPAAMLSPSVSEYLEVSKDGSDMLVEPGEAPLALWNSNVQTPDCPTCSAQRNTGLVRVAGALNEIARDHGWAYQNATSAMGAAKGDILDRLAAVDKSRVKEWVLEAILLNEYFECGLPCLILWHPLADREQSRKGCIGERCEDKTVAPKPAVPDRIPDLRDYVTRGTVYDLWVEGPQSRVPDLYDEISGCRSDIQSCIE